MKPISLLQLGTIVVVGGAVLFSLVRLILYFDARQIRTHPSQKKVRTFVRRGQLKREKKRANRKLRY
jgi:Zn-dependent membrane protease YugP